MDFLNYEWHISLQICINIRKHYTSFIPACTLASIENGMINFWFIRKIFGVILMQVTSSKIMRSKIMWSDSFFHGIEAMEGFFYIIVIWDCVFPSFWSDSWLVCISHINISNLTPPTHWQKRFHIKNTSTTGNFQDFKYLLSV